VGSLEEEPAVLARHLRERGISTVAVAHDDTPVGDNYRDWLLLAAATAGISVVGQAAVSPMAEDVTEPVGRLLASQPQALCYLGLGVAARAVALAVESLGWDGPVVANSALMFGYAQADWRAGWEGWSYCDLVADDNRERQYLSQRSRALAGSPIGVAAYDIGRLLGEALVRAPNLSRVGVRTGLERVKRLPAAGGVDGTLMGFGDWDHAALKGEFLVLRAWQDGRTVEV
jgi:ABC-type branched-subunit amino acid transport system substrate-binding protein